MKNEKVKIFWPGAILANAVVISILAIPVTVMVIATVVGMSLANIRNYLTNHWTVSGQIKQQQ